MAEPAVRAAPSDNLAQVAALLRQAEQQLAQGPGLSTGGGLAAMIRKATETAERLVFMSDHHWEAKAPPKPARTTKAVCPLLR